MVPADGAMKPAIMRKSVVLPEPDGPRMVRKRPRARVKLTSSTATVSPKRLPTPSSATIAGAASSVGGATSRLPSQRPRW